MMTTPHLSVKFQKVLIITACWLFIQLFSYVNSYFTVFDLIGMGRLQGSLPFWPDFAGNIVLGVFGGSVAGYVLVYKVNSGYRRRSFLSGIINAALVFILFYLISAVCILFLMAFVYYAIQQGITEGATRAWENLFINFNTPSIFISMFAWGIMVSITQFMLQVNDKFGQGVLWKFLTGKYYHPHNEERIFMFLDLKSSTAIAEQLGNTVYFELLNEIYRDITEAVVRSLGEIHQYVGDEVVITWPVQQGLRDDNCIQCFSRIKALLMQREKIYRKKYGFAPTVKAGLHIGIATVGEIGVIKKDIVFSGDVLNTTSRIQGECNKYGVDLLVSEELLQRLPRKSQYHINHIGEIELRGKSEKIELNAITMA